MKSPKIVFLGNFKEAIEKFQWNFEGTVSKFSRNFTGISENKTILRKLSRNYTETLGKHTSPNATRISEKKTVGVIRHFVSTVICLFMHVLRQML